MSQNAFVCISIALTENARETVSLPQFLKKIKISHATDCTTFTLHDLTYFLRREGDSAPH